MMTIVEFVEFIVDMIVWCTMWLCYRDSWRQMRAAAAAQKSRKNAVTPTGSQERIISGSAEEKTDYYERLEIEDYVGDMDSHAVRRFPGVTGSDVNLSVYTPPLFVPSDY